MAATALSRTDALADPGRLLVFARSASVKVGAVGGARGCRSQAKARLADLVAVPSEAVADSHGRVAVSQEYVLFESGLSRARNVMSSFDWIAYGGFTVILLVALCRLPRVWRGDMDRMSPVPPGWPWSPIAWRAVIRSGPAAILGGITMVVGLPVLLIAPERAEGGFARPLVVVVPFLVLFALSVLLMLSVALFNRPAFLVAPHLREAPGVFAERAAQRQKRRRRRARRQRLPD